MASKNPANHVLELLTSPERRTMRRGGRALVGEVVEHRLDGLIALRRELAATADPPEESFEAGYRAAVIDWLATAEAMMVPQRREREARRLLVDNPAWWQVLEAARDHLVTPTETKGLLDTSAPTATRVLAALREAGVLEVVPAPKERPHRLTALGTRLLSERDATISTPVARPATAGGIFDPLPEVYAEPVFRSRLAEAFYEARASGAPLAVLHIDIDRFSEFNDRYGLEVGDHVLAQCAASVLETVRATTRDAVVGRQRNCDRFLVMYPASLDDACELAERIKGAASDLELPAIVETRPTASIGVVAMPEISFDDPTDLLQRAREATRMAKDAGRDRVMAAPTVVAEGSGTVRKS
jgi:diguanylate cyclase (GGDEF)-like protein